MTSSYSEKITKLRNALENVFVKKADVKNNLTSTDTDKPLSANQGKELDEKKVDKITNKGLSANDFTDTYKGKLDNLDTNLANKSNINHIHGNLQSDGTIGTTNNTTKNVVTDNHGVISLEDKYTHPNDLGSTKASGLYKIALNDKGHVTSATSVEKSDITGLGIPASDTTYSLADGTTNGLSSNDFTSAEKTKLNGIATGANNYTHPASHGNITSDGKCSTTGTVDVSRGDLLLFADATSNQYTIKGSTFIDALNDLILDLIDEGES